MDRLSNVEIAVYSEWQGPEGPIVSKLAKQLADTMRENELLYKALEAKPLVIHVEKPNKDS